MSIPDIELISFNICPFVQRSVITLHEKNIPFKLTDIDLENPPAWFHEISPMSKVPVLKSDDFILFESAVINEYLDEVTPPSLHPTDPKEKAHNRAWIEFSANLIIFNYRLCLSKDKTQFSALVEEQNQAYQTLEKNLGDGPYFNGKDFSLVDAAFSPTFIRANMLLQPRTDQDLYEGCPKVKAYAETLLAHPAVQKSIRPDFEALCLAHFGPKGSYLLQS
jgi:glutathione S-transferase